MKEAIKKLINHIIFEIKTDYNKLLSRNYSSHRNCTNLHYGSDIHYIYYFNNKNYI